MELVTARLRIDALRPTDAEALFACRADLAVARYQGWCPADVAAARGVPTRALSLVFMLLLGLAVAMAVQVVGALLVLSLLITPAAAATRVSASPVWVPVLGVLFAEVSALGGILLALGASVPISPYITTISFVIYLVCRWVGRRRRLHGWVRRPAALPAGGGTITG